MEDKKMKFLGGTRKEILYEIIQSMYPQPGDALHDITELQGLIIHRVNRGAREASVTYLLNSITNVQEAWRELDKRAVNHACHKCKESCDCLGKVCDDEDCKNCDCLFCLDCLKRISGIDKDI